VDQEDQGAVWVLPVSSGKRLLAFPSANAAANELYGHSWETRRLEARRRAVQREVQTVLSRRRRTVEQVRRDQTRAAEADFSQRRGEVLLANLDSVPKGASSIRLRDPVSEEEVEISLDVTKTAQQNAQRYFTRGKKLRRMATMTEKRLKELNGQIDRLVALGEEVESTRQIQSLDGIEAKLRESFAAKKGAVEPARKTTKETKETQRKKAAPSKGREARPASKKKDAGRPKKTEKKKETSAAARGPVEAKPKKDASEKKKTGREGSKKGKVQKGGTSSSPTVAKDQKSSIAEGTEGASDSKAGLSRRRKSSYYRCYSLKGGWEVLVGKNDRGNDRLLRQVASAEDVWLHAQGVPGSHVIIHHSERGKEVPVRVLEEAARLAAFFSKGKQSGKLAVDYATVKNLRRVKGGRAGQVTYSGQRTILVSPKAPEDLQESGSSEKGSPIEEAV
jgi:predicted ribosome quality control (RQC) complex YloA/Tae2 family protein